MLWFGGYDADFIRNFSGYENNSDEEIATKITWIPLSSDYFWKVNMRSVSVPAIPL